MRKQLLLFGASLMTATGVALVMLALVLMLTGTAFAIPEAAVKDGSQCPQKDNTDCGPNDCPDNTPNCNLKKSNNCDCES